MVLGSLPPQMFAFAHSLFWWH